MNDDLAFTSAAELAGMIARREVSPVEIVDRCLERIDRARRASTRLSRCAPTRRGRRRARPKRRQCAARRLGRCTACRSRSRTWSIPPACARRLPRALAQRAEGGLALGRAAEGGRRHPGRQDHDAGVRAQMLYRGAAVRPHAQRLGPDRTAAARRAAPRSRWRPGVARSASAPMPAARAAFPPPATASSASSSRPAWCRTTWRPEAFANQSPASTPWPARSWTRALMLEAMAGQHPCDPYSLRRAGAGFRRRRPARGLLKGMRIAWRPLLGNTVIDSRGAARPASGAAMPWPARRRRRADGRRYGASIEPIWLPTPAHLERALPPVCCRNGATAEPDAAAADGARQGPQRGRRAAGAARAHPALPQGAGLVRRASTSIVTPTLTRTAIPIGSDLFEPIEIEGRKADTRAQGLVSLHPALQPDGPPGDHAALRLPRRRAADGMQLVGPASRRRAAIARRRIVRAGAALGADRPPNAV